MGNKIYKHFLNIIIVALLLLIVVKANATTNSQEDSALKLFTENYKETIESYVYANEIEKMQNIIFKMTDENPQTLKYAYKYFIRSIEHFNNVPLTGKNANTNLIQIITKIKKKIDSYEKTGASETQGIEYLKLKIIEKTGGDIFTSANVFIKKYPQFENIDYIINIMRDSISPKKPRQIKEYYEALTFLIGKQPRKASHIGTMRLMLKEKKKIEVFAPEVIEIQ